MLSVVHRGQPTQCGSTVVAAGRREASARVARSTTLKNISSHVVPARSGTDRAAASRPADDLQTTWRPGAPADRANAVLAPGQRRNRDGYPASAAYAQRTAYSDRAPPYSAGEGWRAWSLATSSHAVRAATSALGGAPLKSQPAGRMKRAAAALLCALLAARVAADPCLDAWNTREYGKYTCGLPRPRLRPRLPRRAALPPSDAVMSPASSARIRRVEIRRGLVEEHLWQLPDRLGVALRLQRRPGSAGLAADDMPMQLERNQLRLVPIRALLPCDDVGRARCHWSRGRSLQSA